MKRSVHPKDVLWLKTEDSGTTIGDKRHKNEYENWRQKNWTRHIKTRFSQHFGSFSGEKPRKWQVCNFLKSLLLSDTHSTTVDKTQILHVNNKMGAGAGAGAWEAISGINTTNEKKNIHHFSSRLRSTDSAKLCCLKWKGGMRSEIYTEFLVSETTQQLYLFLTMGLSD